MLAYRVYSRYEVLSHFLLNDFRMEDFITVNVRGICSGQKLLLPKARTEAGNPGKFLAPIKPGIYKIPANELCILWSADTRHIFEETDFREC